jgi:Fe2+ or Zn2+ uptake regulation protein
MMEDERVAQKILAYLQEHLESGDTVDGISRWWLLRQRVNESVATVRSALSQLAQEGLICERKMADGHTVYLAKPQTPAPPDAPSTTEATARPEEDESA